MAEMSKIGIPLRELAPFCRKAAAEGAVLLKNEDQMLPITEEDHIAVFGRCQIDYYRSGTGSGGAVNVSYSTNLLEGLSKYHYVHMNKELICAYESFVEKNPMNNGDGTWTSEPWHQEEMPVSEELVQEVSGCTNKAFMVIGRTAGEDKDNEDAPGSYQLTEDEKHIISLLTKYYTQVAIIFNVSNIMDMSFLCCEEAKHIKAVLYTWHGGIEGGNAAADILAGAETPSGHLTDTIAYSIKDYPAYPNYGDLERNFYAEDIYVGYRYFETFHPEQVMYPFGYGLSYTTFKSELADSTITGTDVMKTISIKVKVTNTGAYTGKEVIQIYVSKPQGKLGQPIKELCGFQKTGYLAPGESETVNIGIPVSKLKSYDDSGITGNPYCYVLEAGEYHFYYGSDCRNNKEIVVNGAVLLQIEKLIVLEKLQQAAAPRCAFKRIKPGNRKDSVYEIDYEEVPLRNIDYLARIKENLPKELKVNRTEKVTFEDVMNQKATVEDLVAQLSIKELATIVRGEGMCSSRVTPGTAAAFGGVSEELEAYKIPVGCCADGPSGIRMDTGGKATQLPIGTLLAASFNPQMVEKLFELEGQEMVQNQIDTLLGPGINIHRHPLNGRNFEYFSEDPLITGVFAAACEKGMGKAGVTGTLKHFACNNQERSRQNVDAVVSERALREIYLKAFEMGIKEGGARSVMTTYNPMNGYQNSCNYDLNTTILRGEWGYSGIVMTDWWAKLDDVNEGGKPDYTNMSSMVRAQNDVYMVVNNYGAAINAKHDNTEQAINDGTLTKAELQRCAVNIIRFLLNSPVGKRPIVVKPLNEILPLPQKEVIMENGISKNTVLGTEMIDVSQDNGSKSIVFHIEKDGIYGVNVDLLSTESDRAQMLSQIQLNGEKAADIQTNGTWGNKITQRAGKVKLHKGCYQMEVKHIRPGIQLFTVQFVEEV